MKTTSQKPGQKLGFFMAVALVMGNMIGSGVFLLPSSLAPFGWNAVLGWVLTIGGAMALAMTLSGITLKHPQAGGPVGFVTEAFGAIPGFLVGFSYWVSIWTANVTIAVAAVSYGSVFFPVLGAHSALFALLLIWAITALNLRGARAVGGFQILTLLLKLLPLVAVAIIIALVLAKSGTTVINPLPAEGLSLTAASGSAILTLWALLGFESASVAADRVADPARNVPRATIVGTLATGIIYLIVCSGVALMLPSEAVAKSDAPFTLFVETYWAHGPALLVALFAAVSAIGALNGWCLMQGEVPAAMAKRGILPVWFGGENGAGAPHRALILSSAIASIFVLINSSKSTGELFTFMATVSTSSTLWLYLMCALAAFRMRVALLWAVVGTLYAIWTLWGAGVDVSAMTLLLMVAGLPLYAWARRNRPHIEASESTS